ncbi:unnamed protein product [Xylocopa violacea]|uniref:DUF4794 domain-containing protein n=1 Tax=Xylocopa violacea TaxID=135666 RepID=A0ABP1P6G7_XYLVO
MKVFVALAVLVAAVAAEPPRYRPQQRQFYFARQQEETTTIANAPYQPSNWRPAGPAFNLPQRAPQQQYGAPPAAAPQQRYGVPAATPQQQYGPPPQEATTTEAVVASTTESDEASTVASVTESESEPVNSVNELEDEDLDEQQPQQSGEYYVALPDGRLQRIRYVSRQNIEAMKYFAKIRAENVEPLRGPIYAYAPLQKLQILPAGLQVSVAESKPQKLEIKPVATTQLQYRYDDPAGVLPFYQVPASESRYLLTLQ